MKQALMRAVALIAVLTITAGSWAECAGWQTTAEARMACCLEGDACPMHKQEHAAGSNHIISQTEADSCCAASERDNANPASPNFVSIASLAVLVSPIPLVVLPTRSAFDVWHALTPLPGTQVPRHLLLSVFLI